MLGIPERDWPELFDEIEDLVNTAIESLEIAAVQTQRNALVEAARKRYG